MGLRYFAKIIGYIENDGSFLTNFFLRTPSQNTTPPATSGDFLLSRCHNCIYSEAGKCRVWGMKRFIQVVAALLLAAAAALAFFDRRRPAARLGQAIA